MYGLLQAESIAQDALVQHLELYAYHPLKIPQAYGYMTTAPSILPWLSTILAKIFWERKHSAPTDITGGYIQSNHRLICQNLCLNINQLGL